jgi:hypothetical protein
MTLYVVQYRDNLEEFEGWEDVLFSRSWGEIDVYLVTKVG